jgi:hypothetical protein
MMRKVPVFAAIASLAAFAVVPATAQDRYGSGSNDRYNSGNNSGGEGFYRERNDRTVYFQYERRRFCGVQNEEQLKALGGSFNRVQVVDRLRLSGNNTGGCSWPNGFYRRQNEQAVYMLDGYGSGRGGARVCGIATPQQLRSLGGNNRVKVVPANSNLEAGRQPSRPC